MEEWDRSTIGKGEGGGLNDRKRTARRKHAQGTKRAGTEPSENGQTRKSWEPAGWTSNWWRCRLRLDAGCRSFVAAVRGFRLKSNERHRFHQPRGFEKKMKEKEWKVIGAVSAMKAELIVEDRVTLPALLSRVLLRTGGGFLAFVCWFWSFWEYRDGCSRWV